MKFLVDTNMVVALLNRDSSESATAAGALVNLTDRGHTWCLCPQVLVEFWAIATRPRSANGLAWPVARVQQEVERLFQTSLLIEETPALFPAWLALVARHGVIGKRVHDARLAAAMRVHGITHILTFDSRGFPPGWGVAALTPAEAAGGGELA